MKISVIIPTYNRAKVVTRAIDSVLAQTVKPAEIIIVDDGSEDETKTLLGLYKEKGLQVISKINGGVATARNTGILASSGEWIASLDSDDHWLPKKLEKQIDYHTRNTDILISQTEDIWIRNGRRYNRRKYHIPRAGWIFNDCLKRCMISPSSVMIKREILEEVGLYDEALPACEDYDLWLRVTARYQIGLVKEKLVIKTGGHQDQLSKKYWGLDRFRVSALEKILNFELDENQRRQVLKILVEKLTILRNGSLKREKVEKAKEYSDKISQYRAKLGLENEV